MIEAHAKVSSGLRSATASGRSSCALYLGLERPPAHPPDPRRGRARASSRASSTLPALRLATDLIVEDLRAGQVAGDVRDDVDITVLGAGIEAIILSLLVGTVQSNGINVPRYEAGIFAAFDAMLAPPGRPRDPRGRAG